MQSAAPEPPLRLRLRLPTDGSDRFLVRCRTRCCRRDRGGAQRNPFYCVLALVRTCSRCHPVPAAARGVRRGRPGHRLRRRRDGAVRVRGRLRGRPPGSAQETTPALRSLGVFAGALLAELCVAIVGVGRRRSTPTAPMSGVRLPREVGELFLTKFLIASRSRAAAADRGGRRHRPRVPRPNDRKRHPAPEPPGGLGREGQVVLAVDIVWYLVLSALIFCIGAVGVMTRRSPMVVLICLELMLNAGNLALVGVRPHDRHRGRADLRPDRDDRRRRRGRGRARGDRGDVQEPACRWTSTS